VELIRRFRSEDYATALESWGWLDELPRMEPAFASCFGDVFLQGQDGSFSFLDTLGGKLDRVWPDGASLRAAINTHQAQDEYLRAGLVHAATEAGLVPGPDQVLSFKVPPVLGGELSVENLEIADFVVAVHIAGQIHEQVRSLPPGTSVSGITID